MIKLTITFMVIDILYICVTIIYVHICIYTYMCNYYIIAYVTIIKILNEIKDLMYNIYFRNAQTQEIDFSC